MLWAIKKFWQTNISFCIRTVQRILQETILRLMCCWHPDVLLPLFSNLNKKKSADSETASHLLICNWNIVNFIRKIADLYPILQCWWCIFNWPRWQDPPPYFLNYSNILYLCISNSNINIWNRANQRCCTIAASQTWDNKINISKKLFFFNQTTIFCSTETVQTLNGKSKHFEKSFNDHE